MPKQNYLKEINIGYYIQQRVEELDIPMSRICNFFGLNEKELENQFKQSDLSTLFLLKWSKLLGYDFFRIYSQHLILYAPQDAIKADESVAKMKVSTKLPTFRKHIYTQQVIDFLLMLINTKEKTIMQIVKEYNIPRTTLYKWINKSK